MGRVIHWDLSADSDTVRETFQPRLKPGPLNPEASALPIRPP